MDPRPRPRTALGVLAGGATLLGIMAPLAGMAVAAGLVRPDGGAHWSLGPWLTLEIVGGGGASAVAGAVSRRIGQTNRAPMTLAAIVFCVGLVEAATILRYAGAAHAEAPPGLVMLAPPIAASSVMFGGWRLDGGPRRSRYVLAVTTLLATGSLAVLVLSDVASAAGRDTTISALQLLPVALELALVLYLVMLAKRAWAGSTNAAADPVTRLRSAARQVIGSRIPADILTTELSNLYYAFRRRSQSNPNDSYTMHRRAGYLSILVGLSLVVLVETAAVHMLVRQWSSTAAWILTGLSVYALVWLIGDYRAIVGRPIRVTATHLHMRLGVRWEADIPRPSIARAHLLRPDTDKPCGDTLVLAVLGRPNLSVELKEPVEVTGMYGFRRQVRNLWLCADEPVRLCSALSSTEAAPNLV